MVRQAANSWSSVMRDGGADFVGARVAVEIGPRAAAIDRGPIGRGRPIVELAIDRGGRAATAALARCRCPAVAWRSASALANQSRARSRSASVTVMVVGSMRLERVEPVDADQAGPAAVDQIDPAVGSLR